MFLQIDPSSAAMLVDFAVKQLGPGLTLALLFTAGFCWFFRGYVAAQAARSGDSQRLFQSQLERVSLRFDNQLGVILRRQELFEQSMQAQAREMARENAAVWRETLDSLASMQQAVATLTVAVQQVLDGRGPVDLFPPADESEA